MHLLLFWEACFGWTKVLEFCWLFSRFYSPNACAVQPSPAVLVLLDIAELSGLFACTSCRSGEFALLLRVNGER